MVTALSPPVTGWAALRTPTRSVPSNCEAALLADLVESGLAADGKGDSCGRSDRDAEVGARDPHADERGTAH